MEVASLPLAPPLRPGLAEEEVDFSSADSEVSSLDLSYYAESEESAEAANDIETDIARWT